TVLARRDPELSPIGEIRQAIFEARGVRLGMGTAWKRDERDAVRARSEPIVQGQHVGPVALGALGNEPAIAKLMRPGDPRETRIVPFLAVEPGDDGVPARLDRPQGPVVPRPGVQRGLAGVAFPAGRAAHITG